MFYLLHQKNKGVFMRAITKFFSRLKNNGCKLTLIHYVTVTKNIFYLLLTKLTKYLPLRNIIIFECESDMDDNPRAIYEYLVKEKKYHKYRFVWVVKDVDFCEKNYSQKNTVFVSRFDETPKNKLKFNYYISTAKFFLFSHPHWFKKIHKNQKIIHTTHGTPFKSIEKTPPVLSDAYDFVLCASEYTKDWFLKILRCPAEKAFICPHPRIDLLSVENKNVILSKLFDYNTQDKFIICMPTFKQSVRLVDCDVVDEFSLSVVTTEEEFESLNKFLKDNNIHLIVKLHPLQVTTSLKTNSSSNIHYIQNKALFDKKIQLYNLIGCCDAMITDFSSVMFDYFLLDRPIAFFTNFFDQYNRGYIMDNPKEYLCGEKINSFDDFKKFIFNLANGNDVFCEQRHQINELINNPLPNNCCEKFVEIMFSLNNIKNGEK